jgi:hypothetical protein
VLAAQSATEYETCSSTNRRKQGRKARKAGLKEGLPGRGNCHAAPSPVTNLCQRRRDNFLSFALQQNKKGTLYKSPPKSHCVPTRRETPLSGGQARGRNSGLPLNPCRCLGKGKGLLLLAGRLAFLRGWFARVSQQIDHGEGILPLG